MMLLNKSINSSDYNIWYKSKKIVTFKKIIVLFCFQELKYFLRYKKYVERMVFQINLKGYEILYSYVLTYHFQYYKIINVLMN